jgi:uncharacterized protein involved in exopolysaccharide biosynthesis/Mrp family chromosome partitioning ATPase
MTRATPPTLGEQLTDGAKPNSNALRWAVSVLRRWLPLFLLVVVLVELLAIGVAIVTPPKFTAVARVVFDPRAQNVTNAPSPVAELSADSMSVDTQVEVLKSRATIDRVIKQLDLTHDPEFNKVHGGGVLASILNITPQTTTAPGQDPVAEATAQNVAKNLGGSSLGLSSVIQVGFKSKSPIKAARIANAFADAYIATQLSVKQQASAHMTSELMARLTQLRQSAEQSDAAWRQYQVATGLVNTQSANGATALQQEIQSLTTQLADARASQAEAEAKQGVVAGLTGDRDTFGGALDSPVLQALKRQRNEASAKLADLSARYGPRHPDVVAQNRTIAEIDDQMKGELQRVRSTVTSETRVAQSRAGSLQAQLSAANARLQSANLASVGESQLKNRADADQSVYQSFLDRFKQVSAESGMERPDARVISLAALPTSPSSLPRTLIAAMGLLVGVAAGIVVVALVEIVFGGVYNTNQVVDMFGIASLGSVPELDSVPDRDRAKRRKGPKRLPIDIPITEPLSPFSEMLRGLLASEPFNLGLRSHSTVMLTSSLAGEGKSTCSIALARTLSMQGARVLLVDCDLIRYTMSALLGGAEAGIVELVEGTAGFDKAIQKDPISEVHWIGVSKGSGTPGTFAKPAFRELLAKLRDHYDIIVMDAAPILASSDVRRLAMEVDRVVMAIRWAQTPRSAIRAALKVFTEIEIPVSGAILTRVDLNKQAKMGDANHFDYYYQYQAYRA